ncbi:MAG: aminopeptidase [Firmicutes bacterium]|mgnify:CR=1 FL=1|jgi:leucyl aminopeptidase (aminopeptidase T)|nr:aminopeptidase [Bacillota bacterium]
MSSSKLFDAARVALDQCLGVRANETVLIVTDPGRWELALPFRKVAAQMGAEAILLEMDERKTHGSEPPELVAAAMAGADVVLAVTTKSLSHTKARKQATQAGARVASLPGITRETMERALFADYEVIAARSKEVAQILSRGEKVKITTPAGTDLTLSIKGREGQPDTGILHRPGEFGNLPAGEAYIAPVEGSAQGTLVIDGAMSGVGMLKEPIVMEVRDGVVVDLQGPDADALRGVLEGLGEAAYMIGELGVGTNDQAVICGQVLEDEKVLGTIHIAIGNNSFFGGTIQVASHHDGILREPTVVIDGELLLEKGRLVL